MSGGFFTQLGIPAPDVNLEVGSGSQAEQTGAIMAGYERLLLQSPSMLCLVVGDVTSTMAWAISAHRPANVDSGASFAGLLATIASGARGMPVVFPVHPRTAKTPREISAVPGNLHLVDPQPCLEFNWLVRNAKAVITDSGGVTEETTVMGIPCLTLRDNTERPETVSIGTNSAALAPALDRLFAGQWKSGAIPEMWDGQTATGCGSPGRSTASG